jgi:hypothetical protein
MKADGAAGADRRSCWRLELKVMLASTGVVGAVKPASDVTNPLPLAPLQAATLASPRE